MTALVPEQVSLLLSRLGCAASSFSRRDSLGCFLRVTTATAIVAGHPFAANALTAQEIVQSTVLTAVQIENPPDSRSRVYIDGNIISPRCCKEKNVIANGEQDPPLPRPTPPGGSR